MEISAVNLNDVSSVKKAMMERFVPSFSDFEKAEAETKRFGEIVDMVMRTPIGRQTLTDMVNTAPCSFFFEATRCSGYYFDNKIALNPCDSSKYLASTLVHEATHALQLKNQKDDVKEHTAESFFRKYRAMEADASAKQALFVFQCKEFAPEIYRHHKVLAYPLPRIFNAAMENGKTEEEALRETFLSWYKRPGLVRTYDKNYAEWLIKDAENAEKNEEIGSFSKVRSDDEIMAFCSYKGIPYIDKNDFSNVYVRRIEVGTLNAVQAALDHYAKQTGSKRDISLKTMAPVLSYEDRIKEEKNKGKNAQAEIKKRQGLSSDVFSSYALKTTGRG